MKKYMKESQMKILIGSVALLLACLLGLFAYQNTEKKEQNDAIKFQSEYKKVDKDNVFVYRNLDEIINIIKHGTGVVYLGFPECPWCQAYVPYLNEVAKENGIDKIYYYNIKEDREKNTKEYQEVVSLLSEHLDYNDEGKKRIFVPDVTFVQEGKIIGHDNETSMISSDDTTPEKYWSKENVKKLKEELNSYASNLNTDMCTKCNE